jgi:hypothetical protein
MMTPEDGTQLRDTVERLLDVAITVENIAANAASRSEDAELLDVIADVLHTHGWLVEGIADRVRFARLAQSKPKLWSKALIGLDVDQLDELADLLHLEAISRRL